MENQQENEDSNNSFYSSTSFFTELAINKKTSKKKITQPIGMTVDERVEKIKHQLITQIIIRSPSRLRSCQLRQELRNYRFCRMERPGLSMFGATEEEVVREQQNMFMTLASVIKEYKRSAENKFYLLVKKNQSLLYFVHSVEEKSGETTSYSLINSRGKKLQNDLTKEEVEFKILNGGQNGGREEILIRNYEICVLWGFLMNSLISSNTPFEIVANFPFINSCENLPQELFNNNENKKQFEYIAIPKKNILGEEILEVFHLRMEGYWISDNVQKLAKSLDERFSKNKYDVEFVTNPHAPTFQNFLFNQKKET